MKPYITLFSAGFCGFAAILAGVMGCGGQDSEEVVPDLAPRPATASCLAGIDPATDPDALVLPEALSDTGCFTDPTTLAPAPDLIPYRLNSPLWTDGAVKQRFIVIPPDQKIGFSDTGNWMFPDGSILIKAFILEEYVGDPSSRRSIETRFMVRTAGAWAFFSYRWNDEGTEAHLYADPETVPMEVHDGDTTTTVLFDFPSHDGCVTCHAEVSGRVLGPRTSQLNTVLPYASGRQNQLQAMAAIGLFDAAPSAPETLPALVDPADKSAPIELRARSYMHGNCSHCHQPGGWNSTLIDLDFRYDTAFVDTLACGEPIHHTIYMDQGAYVIDPGNPDNSNMYGRMMSSGPAKMPPLGRSIADPVGTEVVRAWIAGMTGCP